MAEERGVDIPALVYEARPVVSTASAVPGLTLRRAVLLSEAGMKHPLVEDVYSGGSARDVVLLNSGKSCMSTWEALGSVWVRRPHGSTFPLHRDGGLFLCCFILPPPSPAGAADQRRAEGTAANGQAPLVQTERTGLPGLDVSISVQDRHLPESAQVTDAPIMPASAAPAEQLGRTEPTDWLLPDSIKLGLGDFIFYSVLTGTCM